MPLGIKTFVVTVSQVCHPPVIGVSMVTSSVSVKFSSIIDSPIFPTAHSEANLKLAL